MSVIIEIDPHKASRTAVAIDDDEQSLGMLEVVADRRQTPRLLAWAELMGPEREARRRARPTDRHPRRAGVDSGRSSWEESIRRLRP